MEDKNDAKSPDYSPLPRFSEEKTTTNEAPPRLCTLPSRSNASLERETRPSRTVTGEKDLYSQSSHMWVLFQEAAGSTSKLFRARSSGRDGLWHNFQNAASAISMLYKESLDLQEKSYDSGYRAGVEKAYEELMEWMVQNPRFHSRKSVRTDDLMNFIYSPTNPATYNPKLRLSKSMDRGYSSDMHGGADQHLADLQAFRDALHVSSLNGGMSHVNLNRSPPRHQHSGSPSLPRPVDLHAFVTEEIRRHKRSSSTAFGMDGVDYDDTSSYKRSRFTPPK